MGGGLWGLDTCTCKLITCEQSLCVCYGVRACVREKERERKRERETERKNK